MAYKNQPLYPGQCPQGLAAILAELPECHGKPSDPNRNVRRRWRKRQAKKAKRADEDRKTTLESELFLPGPPSIPVGHARDVIVYHVNIDPSQSQPESQSAAGPPPQDEQNRTEDHDQARGGAERETAAPRRVDSWKNGETGNSSPEALSQLHNKPALSANSTSAEIVEALMPDRPAPVRSPRRAASLDFCYEQKMALREEIMAWVAERKAW